MLPPEHPDRIQVAFDDHRLVDNAGLLLPATLAQRVGLRELVDRHLDLGDAPGRANAGDKLLTLVASALAGGDCIDYADALRAGRTYSVLGSISVVGVLAIETREYPNSFSLIFRWPPVLACRRDVTVGEVLAMLIFVPFRQGCPGVWTAGTGVVGHCA